MKYKDRNGDYISEGDRLIGSYGIPPITVNGNVIRENKRLWFKAKGNHKPKYCRLKEALDCLDLILN